MSSLFKTYKSSRSTPATKKINTVVSDRLKGLVNASKIDCPSKRFQAYLEAFRALEKTDRTKRTVN
jgi:hypothetical protein